MRKTRSPFPARAAAIGSIPALIITTALGGCIRITEVQFIAGFACSKRGQVDASKAVAVIAAVGAGTAAILRAGSHIIVRVPVVAREVPLNAAVVQVAARGDEPAAAFMQFVQSERFVVAVLK